MDAQTVSHFITINSSNQNAVKKMNSNTVKGMSIGESGEVISPSVATGNTNTADDENNDNTTMSSFDSPAQDVSSKDGERESGEVISPSVATDNTNTADDETNDNTTMSSFGSPAQDVSSKDGERESGEVISPSVATDNTNTADDENNDNTTMSSFDSPAQDASSVDITPARMTGNQHIIGDGCSSQIKMLLIGETGAGKTSLVDLIKNYEKFQDIDFDSNKIETFITENDTNKSTFSMDPLTTEINHYELDLKQKKVKWTIIDTPGLNDTSNSAENQCEKSIDKIVSHLNKDGSINTICLVVNAMALILV